MSKRPNRQVQERKSGPGSLAPHQRKSDQTFHQNQIFSRLLLKMPECNLCKIHQRGGIDVDESNDAPAPKCVHANGHADGVGSVSVKPFIP